MLRPKLPLLSGYQPLIVLRVLLGGFSSDQVAGCIRIAASCWYFSATREAGPSSAPRRSTPDQAVYQIRFKRLINRALG